LLYIQRADELRISMAALYITMMKDANS